MIAPPAQPGPGAARVAIVLCAVYAVFWVQFSIVRPVNFGGVDEWMILSLVSRGAVDVPYANRPLGLLFNLPVGLFPTRLLDASWLLHAHYLVMAGLFTSLLLLRLAPGRPDWALLAGVFAATWAPSDLMRLDAIYSSAYSGVTAATALVLLLLATRGGRAVHLALAMGLAFVTTRVHEAPLPVLLLAPLLLGALGAPLPRGALAVYWSTLGLAALVAGLPLLLGRSASWYQSEVLGLYLDPAGLASRMALQFRLHLAPLVSTAPATLLKPRPLAAAALLVLALALLRRPVASVPTSRRRLARAVVVGVVGAAAAYSSFIVAAKLPGATRTEFLAAPWIGLALGAGIVLVGDAFPSRARFAIVATLGAGVAACGAVRVEQLQAVWDATGFYERQSGALRQMIRVASDFKAGTLVLYIEGLPTWIGSFAFHHGLEVVYGRHVAGCVPNERAQLFYRCWQSGEGIRHEPWPVLRAAWGAEPRTYRFDEVAVFRADAAGRIELLEEWPADLPALPVGGRYEPRLRLVHAASPPATRLGLPGF